MYNECLQCGNLEDPNSPGFHLNPDLDLDHDFVSEYDDDGFDDIDLWLDDLG